MCSRHPRRPQVLLRFKSAFHRGPQLGPGSLEVSGIRSVESVRCSVQVEVPLSKARAAAPRP